MPGTNPLNPPKTSALRNPGRTNHARTPSAIKITPKYVAYFGRNGTTLQNSAKRETQILQIITDLKVYVAYSQLWFAPSLIANALFSFGSCGEIKWGFPFDPLPRRLTNCGYPLPRVAPGVIQIIPLQGSKYKIFYELVWGITKHSAQPEIGLMTK